jgi:hypothetical protein
MNIHDAVKVYLEMEVEVASDLLRATLARDVKSARSLDTLNANMLTDLEDIQQCKQNNRGYTRENFVESVASTLERSKQCQSKWGYNQLLNGYIIKLELLLDKMKQEGPTVGQIAGMYRAVMLEVMREEVEAFKDGNTITGTRFKMLRKKLEEKEFNELNKDGYKSCLFDVLSFAYESNLAKNIPEIKGYLDRLYEMAQIEVA